MRTLCSSDVEHAHVPYALVLVKLVNEWRAAHAGALPATRCEKDAFRATVAAAARTPTRRPFNQEIQVTT